MRILEDRVAIVTGGGGGIGGKAAEIFAREGAKVVVADVEEERATAVVEAIRAAGGAATFCATDVAKRADVTALVQAALSTYGKLDAAFNTAGVSGPLQPLVGYPDEWFERVIDINVRGTWYCLQEQIPAMIMAGGGAIVNTSSGLGVVGCAGMPAYIASKHAVMGLTQAAAIENATQGVRVNALLPGIIDTRMPEELTAAAPEVKDMLVAAMPIGRLGQPEEVAEAAVWLCSSRASFVTGHGMAVDGGYLSQ
jgi:NAD(P)-dependent dehydrogenase (short-subunit alcohol dehydrogenase family)